MWTAQSDDRGWSGEASEARFPASGAGIVDGSTPAYKANDSGPMYRRSAAAPPSCGSFPDGYTRPSTAQIFLHPGEAHLSRGPVILKTILGSCVGATFWSPRLRIGALCHGMLPKCPEGVAFAEGYRYVDFALRDLVRRFELLGADRTEIEIRLFGGADMLPPRVAPSRIASVGEANCQTAMEVLKHEGLSPIMCELGGSRGRTIQFHTWDGRVFQRRHSS